MVVFVGEDGTQHACRLGFFLFLYIYVGIVVFDRRVLSGFFLCDGTDGIAVVAPVVFRRELFAGK